MSTSDLAESYAIREIILIGVIEGFNSIPWMINPLTRDWMQYQLQLDHFEREYTTPQPLRNDAMSELIDELMH